MLGWLAGLLVRRTRLVRRTVFGGVRPLSSSRRNPRWIYSNVSLSQVDSRNPSNLSSSQVHSRNPSNVSLSQFDLRNSSNLSLSQFNLRNRSTVLLCQFDLRKCSLSQFDLRNRSNVSLGARTSREGGNGDGWEGGGEMRDEGSKN